MSAGIEVSNIVEYPTEIKITIVVIIHDGENILIVRKPEEPYSELAGKLIFPSSDLRDGEDYTKTAEIARRIIRHDLGLDIEGGKIFGAETNPPRLRERSMKDAQKEEKYLEFPITVCLEAKLISRQVSTDIDVLKRWEEAKWVPLSTFLEPEFDAARKWLPEVLVEYLCLMGERMYDSGKKRE